MTYIYIPTVSADQGGWQKETNSNQTAEEAASPEQGHVSFALGLWLLASFGNLQLAQQAWDLSRKHLVFRRQAKKKGKYGSNHNGGITGTYKGIYNQQSTKLVGCH